MLRIFLKGLCALTLVACASHALAKPLTHELQMQMEANLARGELLYAYDQAAWHTTDAMAAALPEATKKLLRGYIVTPDGNNLRTTFYGQEGAREFAVYSATWDGSAIIRPALYSAEPRPTDSAEELRMIAARNVATNIDVIGRLGLCSEGTPNVTVIPGATPADPISVYVMTPQTENGMWPLGGHYRIDVKDGRIVSRRAFTNSCINLGGGAKKDEKVVMMTVSHVLDAIPTEIHAFTMLTSGISVQVVTQDSSFALWRKNGKTVVTQDK